MDHSVKAMNSHRKLAFSRLLNRHRFENAELESLYQRYIFKLQHSSVASVVALFVVLTGILANLSLAYAQAPTAQNIYHSLHCLLFALLLAFLNTRLMQDAYLLWVCYAILFFCTTFCAVALPLGKFLRLQFSQVFNDRDSGLNGREETVHCFQLDALRIRGCYPDLHTFVE
jgi:adenylate cyclase 1